MISFNVLHPYEQYFIIVTSKVKEKKKYILIQYFIDILEKNTIASEISCLGVLSYIKRIPPFPFKAQAAGKIHSAFRSLSNAINTSTGEYLLESTNKLFGEKSARFKEVSETCNLNGRAANLQPRSRSKLFSLIHPQ